MVDKSDKKYELKDVQYHKIDEFPKDFDLKSVDEDLNTCDKCGIIVVWHNEMFWQGDCYESYHWCMLKEFNKEDSYNALCDDCFYKLPSLCRRNDCKNNPTNLLEKIKSYYLFFLYETKWFIIDKFKKEQ